MYEVSFPFLLAGARLFNIFQPAVYLRNFSLGLFSPVHQSHFSFHILLRLRIALYVRCCVYSVVGIALCMFKFYLIWVVHARRLDDCVYLARFLNLYCWLHYYAGMQWLIALVRKKEGR